MWLIKQEEIGVSWFHIKTQSLQFKECGIISVIEQEGSLTAQLKTEGYSL